jgi:hypothetical protein
VVLLRLFLADIFALLLAIAVAGPQMVARDGVAPLIAPFREYSDKCHERIFAEFNDKPVRLLEIGVKNGGSLEIWAKFFLKGLKFVGCGWPSVTSIWTSLSTT